MTLQEYQRGDPFTPHVHCVQPDRRHRTGECGEPGVALLVEPSGRRSGRCREHATTHEARIRANVTWSEYHIEWLDR